ncbi:MAG: DUF167 domain-containing protein [Actinomycetota bacterium]|nr:DUF167 domain-containing protein [Actinomycetota bacterium]
MGRIPIRLQPRASNSGFTGERDPGDGSEPAVVARVTAPPVDGKANAALIKLVAKQLGVAKSAVRIVQGETGRDKLLEIEDLSTAEIRKRLVPVSGS